MKPFDSNYRKIKKNNLLLDETRNDYVDLRDVLPEIIAYLRQKYNTRISLAIRGYQKDEPTPLYLNAPSFLSRATETQITEDLHFFKTHYLAKIQQIKGDYREAFIFGHPHVVLVVYVKEEGQEVLLLMDSIGSYTVEVFKECTGLKTLALIMGRQVNFWSCIVDALVLGRDLTAFDEDLATYKIPDLLIKLNPSFGTITQLPDVLLKTAESSSFIKQYRYELPDQIIHKKETLNAFRARYTDTQVLSRQDMFDMAIKYRNLNSYLRKKSFKYADIAEIQYYLDQLEQEIARSLMGHERRLFRDLAKAELKLQGSLIKNPYRPRLQGLAERFLTELDDRMPELIEDSCPPSEAKKAKSSAQEQIAAKYQLPLEEILDLERAVIEALDHIKSSANQSLQIFNLPKGHIATELALNLCKNKKAYIRVLPLIAQLSQTHADLLLADTQLMDWIYNLTLRSVLETSFFYRLFAINPYMAQKGLALYRERFYIADIRALEWVAASERPIELDVSKENKRPLEVKKYWETTNWSFIDRNSKAPLLLFDVTRNRPTQPDYGLNNFDWNPLEFMR